MEDNQQPGFFSRRRLLILIAVVLLVLAILAIVWWFFWRAQPTPTVDLTPPANVNEVVLPNPNDNPPTAGVTPANPLNEVAVVARNFVERFGSYSNQAAYQNIKDLYPLMTASFRQSLNLSGLPDDQGYVGVDTKVLNISIDSQTAASASLTLNTQRWQRDASLKAEVSYQKITVQLIKSGDQWLINQANWQ